MNDVNECRLSGIIDRVRPIPTRSGKVMAEIILLVNQGRFRVVAFGNVGQRLLSCMAGERLTVTGQITTSSWKDETTGEWKNSWGITAWGAEIDGKMVAYRKGQKDSGKDITRSLPSKGRNPLPTQREYDIPTPPPNAMF